jgi:hypothetical protein
MKKIAPGGTHKKLSRKGAFLNQKVLNTATLQHMGNQKKNQHEKWPPRTHTQYGVEFVQLAMVHED